MTVEDRNTLIRRLLEDLIGPFEEEEELNSRPSDVYLSGILWPKSTSMGAEENERLSLSGEGEGEGTTGTGEEEEVSRTGMKRPSSAGISFAVSSPGGEPVLSVKISFATYEPIEDKNNDEKTHSSKTPLHGHQTKWKRHPVLIEIPDLHAGPKEDPSINLESHGAPPNVYIHRRIASWGNDWLITLTLVNGSQSERGREAIEQNSLFQVRFEVRPGYGTGLIARPSRRMEVSEDMNEDDCSTALLYRNAFEYAVGHTCSAEWEADETGHTARMVSTTWIPYKLVPATNPAGHKVFSPLLARKEGLQPLSALWLSKATDEELNKSLMELPAAYNAWIELQEKRLDSLDKIYRDQAMRNLEICRNISDRIKEGATKISQNPQMSEAFRLANQAMHMQYSWDRERKGSPLIWRPFQLGFILLAATSVADRSHRDRGTMDLLWFPTGGGKTEAYLALIAFLAFYRRLSSDKNPDNGAGVAAVMRYTLRLLTTQQFSRAASMILACEAIRRGSAGGPNRTAYLGTVPFSIGLWVGAGATPNNFEDAEKALLHGGNDLSSPKQLTDCPACGSKLAYDADKKARAIHVRCKTRECILHDIEKPLPVFTVDEDIYREHPTLLIGTVDKFAQIVRKEEINKLFSISSGHPPDLILQDELHLISGPLGTLVGLYEVAIDRMFTRGGISPKIIGSTATIRRATEQVRALFNRETCQFPPPAIDADDSGFAVKDTEASGRLYAGVTTAGRSAKFTLQAVAASLLQSAYGSLTEEGKDNYGTLVTYFNSLRELGGALVLMQDDVNDSIGLYADRRKEIQRNTELIEELTSRRTQAEIRDMLDCLAIRAGEQGSLDVVLATNMLSVGVDIPRLGLMIVNGQPKGISEYIQATGRVGRGRVPGLMIAVLNNAKPRDRSHYESFGTWHSTLYRDVEPTSVTPFASRARDRALHAVLVSLVRHLVPGMLTDPPAIRPEVMAEIGSIIDSITARASLVDPEETDVREELITLLKKWELRSPRYYWNSHRSKETLLIDAEKAAELRALGLHSGSAWSTMNNLRSVEPSTRFKLVGELKDFNKEGDAHSRKQNK